MPSPSRFQILRSSDVQQSRVQDGVAGVLAPVARALINTPIMGAAPPATISPTLLNGWRSIATYAGTTDAAGRDLSTYEPPGYHRDALGYVHVYGVAITDAGCPALTSVFTLASGWRPAKNRVFRVYSTGIQAITVTQLGDVEVVYLACGGDSVALEFSFLAA